MKIKEVIACLEDFATPHLQEDYDNAGLLIGGRDEECTGIIASLDVTENVIDEAVRKKCNLVVAHHPIIFRGLKRLTGANYVERTVIAAIRKNIAVYAIHTNLDNVIDGVNKKIAEKIGLKNLRVLQPKKNILKKMVAFAPLKHAEAVRDALFTAGGKLGTYSECSFNAEGTGTFKAEEGADPYVGEIGKRHEEKETRIEVIFQIHQQTEIVKALKEAHPYEEVAFDVYPLDTTLNQFGSGMIGELAAPITEKQLLSDLKNNFHLSSIRHTQFLDKQISKVAVCGGAGSFLIHSARAAGAQAFITSDIKYHEFFDADSEILVADIGHFESEQFTTDLLADILKDKFHNFAVLKTEIATNPVNYF
ncbi:MAG: Nif3-like dinuclear metal center hexameric protein [Ginsengibacter sp.]